MHEWTAFHVCTEYNEFLFFLEYLQKLSFAKKPIKPWKSKLFLGLSHVVGVLQISYLLSCAGGWLSQHYYAIATVIIYKSQKGALLNVRTKGLREFKQGIMSYKEEYKRIFNYEQWQFDMLNRGGNMTARMGKGNYSYGLLR